MEEHATNNVQQGEVKDHLVILVHGLHGGTYDLEYLRDCIDTKYPSAIAHCAQCNDGFLKTHEGIDTNGIRLAQEINSLHLEYPNVQYFSIIGHSLGGMISRYCIGELYEQGFFEKVKPVNFITIATPHVGSRRSPSALFNQVASWFTSTFLSKTGAQLLLQDVLDDSKEKPLLIKMSNPDSSFYKALQAFQTRTAYANISGDFQVPYSTAAISPRNPYLRGERQLIYLEQYPHIVEDEQDTETSIEASSKGVIPELEEAYTSDRKKEQLRIILKNLHSLSWKRVAVSFGAHPLAHEMIIAKRPWMRSSDDVVRHLVDHFMITKP